MNKNYIASKKFNSPKILHGFFTRKGGFSMNNFSSLNCSYNSGDTISLINKNILQAQKELSLDKKKIKLVNQIHSNKTIVIDDNNFLKKYEADGIITQDKNICIAVLTADCCPIFLFDDEKTFISCLHVGWKGAYYNIIKNTLNKINKIQKNFNSINAIIGPCLSIDNFEISNEFKTKFVKIDSNYANFFSKDIRNDKYYFNMRNLIKYQLMENKINNIDDIDLDTYSEEDLFYSHRRSTHINELETGRMINIIGFEN